MSLGRFLGGLLGRLGGLLAVSGASWGVLGASGSLLGASCGQLRGPLRGFLEGPLGAISEGIDKRGGTQLSVASLQPLKSALGALLKRSFALSGRSWGHLGLLFGAILDLSWALGPTL